LAVDAVMFFKRFPSAAFLHSLAVSQIREYRVAMVKSASPSKSGAQVDRFFRYGVVVLCVAVVVSQDDGLNAIYDFLRQGDGSLSIDFGNERVRIKYNSATGKAESYRLGLIEPHERLTHH
jgi:hypothetical protein